MGLNETPKGDRVHIALFGRRNAGKSSLINAITNQQLSIVSQVKGTTTDPVYKAMELLPLGPVMMIDTPGLDDEGELGQQRIEKTKEVLHKTDVAILVLTEDGMEEHYELEGEIAKMVTDRQIPMIIVWNKSDQYDYSHLPVLPFAANAPVQVVSASSGAGIHALKECIGAQVPDDKLEIPIVQDLIEPNDFVVLVVPIDSAAPKGRLILPQQQTIRDILEKGAVSIVTKETELKDTLENLGKKPALVITDSQAFASVSKDTPKDIPLTSFSILFARHKGNLAELVQGANSIKKLKDGDTVLISEGCTHHRQCDDIGTVKIPRWLKEFTGKDLIFETSSGNSFPDDLKKYALVVHCGGCMLNQREMQYRIRHAGNSNVPIVNYGVLIAMVTGILKRSLEVFPDLYKELD
ncbi:MAG: [FeFe] hydrogenase H-cluster maturation GTPase HydF [Clostridiales bacterium]|nr:[FeFe] hydrogenase H-cluster maturation GTPase HydF [Clostridiales bacterium]